MSDSNKDYVSDIIDEIALEGLDGITLEALWVRLSERPKFIFKPNDEHVRKFLWCLISKLSNVAFYSLPVAREKLVTFNRLEHVDPQGNFYEPEDTAPCIYPHCPVEDAGIMGSCSTYKNRKDITKTVREESYEDVKSRGNTLVIVADQNTRNTAIFSMDFNPLTELGLIQYCILERIGRSRYQGEVTQGKRGLQVVTDDPKMLYYFRKLLVKNKLVTKQLFYMKINKQTATGSLIHLPRFYSEIKTRQDSDARKLIDCLEKCPHKSIPVRFLKNMLNIELKKIFSKYPNNFKTMMVPYRTVMPTAKPNDWKMKSTGEEKIVRVVSLVSSNLSKDDEEEEDDEEEMGLMDESQRRLDRCLMRQAYTLVEQSGPSGLKQSTLGNLLAVPSLQARSICKHLVKKKLVRTVLIDIGRQRISHFYCAKFENSEYTPSMEVQDEKTKLLQAININSELCDEKLDATCSEESISVKNQGSEISHGVSAKEKESERIEVTEKANNKNNTNIASTGNTVASSVDTSEIEEEIIIKPIGERTTTSLTEEVKYLDNPEASNSLTARMLKRASLIVQAINLHKVIQDYQKILKMINEGEESEGLKQTIDRKTIQRLVDKLESDGLVKIIKVNLKGHGKEKNMVFICHPTVTENHSEIQSAIEQAKMKLPIVSAHHTKKSILKKNQDAKRLKQPVFKHDVRAGRRYGYKPKFIRMHIFHTYMFYLIYGYDGVSNLDQSCKYDIIKKLNLDESLVDEMSTVYRNEVDWKMFLPPLPSHAEYPEGWCLLSDVLLRLPLCLFVSIVNVSYDIPGLMEYVEHPLRKYFLVKHLPSDILHHLTLMRKYIFVISEVVFRLAYLGITQMGPQKLKEKDQVFIYLNRNAILYNTMSSEPGYNQISKDKTYEKLNYHFSTLNDLETYWFDLWKFAMYTNLGNRNGMTGQSVVVESINTKKELLAAVQPKTIEEANSCDIGYLPGDNLGAAGLDSDMFVHLKRNWYWAGKKCEDYMERSILYPPVIELFNITSKKRKTNYVHNNDSKPSTSSIVNKPKRAKNPEMAQLKLTSTARKSRAISKKKTRIVKQRKTKFARKPYYDQIDKDALSRMVKLRVDWSPVEDNLLLICKVASLYLVTDKKRHIAKNFCAVREVLHSTYPSSRNKTSRACQRRIRYMMRNPSTSHSVYLCLEEVKQDPEINVKFHRAIEKLDALLKSKGEGLRGYQEEYDKIFINLVTTLFKKLKTINNSDNTTFDISLPDSVEEFYVKYTVVIPRTLTLRNGAFQEVQKPMDILASVINSVIHSSLCCTTDKTSYSQHLFYIYQQYPDKLLRSVMAKCRYMSIVSCRRRYKRWKTAGNDCLPLASTPFQLSITYVHILQTKYQYNIFSECYNGLKQMLTKSVPTPSLSNNGSDSVNSNILSFNIKVSSGGECANIVELFSAGLIKTLFEFPEQLIVLDPRLSETEESYKLIMKRFREMLSIIKDARKKEKKTILSEDEYDDDEDEDKVVQQTEESDRHFEQFNLKNKIGVVNTASRLALYLMRDEPLEQLDQSLQHAHDYFVLNPCEVTAQFDKSNVENTIFYKEKKLQLISDIKRLATFPTVETENYIILNRLKTQFPEELIASLLHFLECKGDLGATVNDIKDNFINIGEIVKLLSVLVDEQYILRTGVINVRYIHAKFTKSWLVKSFFLLRHSRENIETSNTNSAVAISFANTDSVSRRKSRLRPSSNVDNNECEPPTKKMKPINDTEVINLVESPTNSESEKKDEPHVENIQSNSNHSKIDADKMEIDLVDTSNQKEKLIKENLSINTNEGNREECSDVSSDNILQANEILEEYYSLKTIPYEENATQSTNEQSKGTSLCNLAVDEKAKLSSTPSEATTSNDSPIQSDVTAESTNKEMEKIKEHSRFLMKTTKRKWVTLPNENVNKFANFDTSDVKHVNVLIRPWIKVDGTLNRRVLDRMLGSVLGHCLASPGISLQKVQERFTPALQPVHTFELVEILNRIECLRLIKTKKSWNCTLTSERAKISIEPTMGLENPAEILIDPDPLAVSKLGYFIGDKNYTIDYLDALTNSKVSH